MARRSRRKLFFWRFLVWALMILAFGRVSYLLSVNVIKYIFNEGTIIVPDLKGTKLSKAKTILSAYKINIVQTSVKHHDFYSPGTIIEQDPRPGNRIKKRNRINVTVSSGRLTSLIPDLQGMLLIDAEKSLRKYGFVPGSENYLYSDNILGDRVIASKPQAKERVKAGTVVDILISKGKKKNKILVPDLSGMTKNEVLSTYDKYRFNIHYGKDENAKHSCVYRQVPSPGQPANDDDAIDIWVNETVISVRGNRHYEMISYQVPPGAGEKREFKIILTDEQGVREVLNRRVMPGEKIEYTVSGMGKIKLGFYLDGILVKTMEY